MPYNTRRKSLSLPLLGIHLPNTSRRSPPSSKPSHATDEPLPPSKKVKRSHESESPEPTLPGSNTKELTPPPSPTEGTKIDVEGINDDIVVGVIEQLEKTANRPHLVKELAAVLLSFNESVANSANPAALLSSRLSAYMKRPWTALAPCPIAKELILIHPRKVYYYLTTLPRQPIPENSDDVIIPGIDGKSITPSISIADDDEEQEEEEDVMRRQRSLSPEVDLSSPDFEGEEDLGLGACAGSGSARHSPDFPDHRHHGRLIHSNRAASPPLEGDEKEFTQTASAVRERASEQKASQLAQAKGGFSALTEALQELDDMSMSMSISGTPVDDGALASLGEDPMPDAQVDYFSMGGRQEQSPLQEQLQQQALNDATVATLFGTSPSPSLTSVASSVSSGMSAASDDDLDAEPRPDSLSAPHITLPEVPTFAPVSTLKRSLDMLNSELPDLDLKMSDLTETEEQVSLGTRLVSTPLVDMTLDSWRELQSPESVDVDELDEMFGEI
ncbi:hypothetical protein P175DRAFT_0477029 [Aspergillus ochraceoroseus IBT 24754]|uniref:GDS1 winged helix domain-containing protein n=2 Tax=Aspergillus ochraceoroseus TaxID=138278 RepID=A0A2T5LZE9_9EURO|nr:uncharacterized protein P175DRAFT_0477029 [Aspergillus ochraceoroseus IBT 24754]KKK12118.1 hypothetical protein AOCH_007170 [Aspergillus ochraceoroseus]PTU21654.1 hypothetical protein P175DRAFT_0477029 [Aspergillus ochraceoroseus IBT 24754]